MSASIVRRILPRIVCVLALVLLAAASSPATASATTYYGWFDYARNGSNTNGLLAWGYVVNDMPPIHATYWRAGSGLRPDDGTGGWLPAGFYSVRGHWDNYNGTRIWGRVWYLSDKRGTSGDLRTGLFVHTEETMYNGQYNPTAGDDPKCWEGTSTTGRRDASNWRTPRTSTVRTGSGTTAAARQRMAAVGPTRWPRGCTYTEVARAARRASSGRMV
jgi:hypothetical protein